MEIREIALVVAAAFFFMLMLADHYFFEKRIKEVEDRFIRYRKDIHDKMSNIVDNNTNILEHCNRCLSLCNDLMFGTEKVVDETKKLIAVLKNEEKEQGEVDEMDDVMEYCAIDVRATKEAFLALQESNVIAAFNEKGGETNDREGTGE